MHDPKLEDSGHFANPPQYQDMVSILHKRAEIILGELIPEQVDLIHAVMGISGEAGELLDQIKKHTIYQKPLDMKNVIEELGDIEFYLEQLRQALGITREITLFANMEKLKKRYPNGFSNEAAQARADKVEESQKNVSHIFQDFPSPNRQDK